MIFRESYESAWHKGYRDLEPANLYNVDYSLLGTARVEPLIRRIRNCMELAGMAVENSKEIAAQEGVAISFMAKFDEREGSSCHIHFSLADEEGMVFARDRGVARAAFGEDVVAHYVHATDVEVSAFEAAVTDWERIRGFERL